MENERHPFRRSRHDLCTHHEVPARFRRFNLDDDGSPIESRQAGEAYWSTILDCHRHEFVGQARNRWSRAMADDEPRAFVNWLTVKFIDASGRRAGSENPVLRGGPGYLATSIPRAIIDEHRKKQARPQEVLVLDQPLSDDGDATLADVLADGSGVGQERGMRPDDVSDGAGSLAALMEEDPAHALAVWLRGIAPAVREAVAGLTAKRRAAVWQGLHDAGLDWWEAVPSIAGDGAQAQSRRHAWKAINEQIVQDDVHGLLSMLDPDAAASTVAARRTAILSLLVEHGHLSRDDFTAGGRNDET